MKLKFTALDIAFCATVKYTPSHPGSHDEPPADSEVDILTLTHTEHKNGRNDTYDCLFLLGATCGDKIIEAAEKAAEVEMRMLGDQTQIDRAEARQADWSAA